MIKGITFFLSYLYLLPFLGFLFVHQDKIPYFFEFPPKTKYFDYKSLNFSFYVFFLYVLTIFSVVYVVYIKPIIKFKSIKFTGFRFRKKGKICYPKWGYLGWIILVISWFFSWFLKKDNFLRNNSFFPLWIGYILVVNSLTYKIKGTSFIVRDKVKVISLFLLSSIFWWSFEYLNRFTQNWVYITAKTNIGSFEYFIRGSICFSTVLPAILSTAEFLFNFEIFKIFGEKRCLKLGDNLFNVLIMINGVILFLIGVFPKILYPFLWISPIFAFTFLMRLLKRVSLKEILWNGNLKAPIVFSSASLICGFFWEFWNFYSIPKWKYDIPYLNGFYLFEMPIVGYAGYLPFGLECFCVLLLFNYINEEGKVIV